MLSSNKTLTYLNLALFGSVPEFWGRILTPLKYYQVLYPLLGKILPRLNYCQVLYTFLGKILSPLNYYQVLYPYYLIPWGEKHPAKK